jgi:hypothetical protein
MKKNFSSQPQRLPGAVVSSSRNAYFFEVILDHFLFTLRIGFH